MTSQHVNTTIQLWKTHAPNTRPDLTRYSDFTFLILKNQVSSQKWKTAIVLCSPEIFRSGLLLLHCTMFGQQCSFSV